MTIVIRRPNNDTEIEFLSDNRLIVLAGPNGVGKSTIIREIGTKYTEPSGQLPISRNLGAYIDGSQLSPTIINAETMKKFVLPLGGNEIRAPQTVEGITWKDVEDALSDKAEDAKISDQAAEIRQKVGSEDAEAFRNGDVYQRIAIAEKLQKRFSKPRLDKIADLFYAHHLYYARRKYKDEDEESILADIGELPWIKVQRVLDALDLKYDIIVPNINTELPDLSLFQVRRRSDGVNINSANLSSGESTVLSLFNVVAGNSVKGKIYLFDDVDGFLHAPFLKNFLKVLQDVLRQDDSWAIWVTHSPLFVQMCNDATFYYLSQYNGLPRLLDKAALVQILTDGQLVVADNFLTVFAEGSDATFYNRLFEAFVAHKVIKVSRQIKFTSPRSNPQGSDANAFAVDDIVRGLHQHGYGQQFRGLIDHDRDRLENHSGVLKVDRYCKENYIFDPINIYSFCIDNNMTALADLPKFEGVDFGMSYKIKTLLHQQQLQLIVDYFRGKVLENKLYLTLNSAAVEADPIEVTLSNGVSVTYPAFFVKFSGKHLVPVFVAMNREFNPRNLTAQVFKGPLWSNNLVNVIQQFC